MKPSPGALARVVGAPPNCIKTAPLRRAFAAEPALYRAVHQEAGT